MKDLTPDFGPASTSFSMPTILVVEDNDDIREVVAETLRDEGYHVLEAEHGQRALELLDAVPEPPSLVLLDLMMPVMSGVEFMCALDARGRLDSMPVVVLSAGGRPEDAQKARRFVRKPPSQELLLKMVEEFCGPPPRH
ncbi:MAG: chemotaxis protein CheY [Myxococcaceae bacterium]|nr:chemotaxis protein CheY [Myxococcaceae bacterium]